MTDRSIYCICLTIVAVLVIVCAFLISGADRVCVVRGSYRYGTYEIECRNQLTERVQSLALVALERHWRSLSYGSISNF